ncbi:hypothetical protein JCM10213v2_007357 [Rhodosporidiobolus nylandii]
MPFKFEMGAKTWRDPVTHAKFVEEEKADAQKLEQAKNKKETEAFKKEVEAERTKISLEKLKETGRLLDEGKANERLAKLKLDVARLEAKATNAPQPSSEQLIATFDKDKVANQAADRGEAQAKEVKLTAVEMLKVQEKELEEKRKRQEKELAELAEQRRRQLLDYKHSLGLLASPSARQPPRRPRFAGRPLALHDDPEFWKLPAEDQHLLETMTQLRQRFEELGIGQSKLGGIDDKGLEEKMRRFVTTERPNIPGIIRRFPPLELALPLDVDAPEAYESAQDRQTAAALLRESSRLLRDDLVRTVIEQTGANGMVEFRVDGPYAMEDEELVKQGFISQLVAIGIPVRLDPSIARHAHRGGGGKSKVHFGAHPPPAQQGWGAQDGAWGWGAGQDDGLFGSGLGVAAGGNGGAGWTDPVAVNDGAWGGDAWGGGGGGAGKGKKSPWGWGPAGQGKKKDPLGGGGWGAGGEDLWGSGGGGGNLPGAWGEEWGGQGGAGGGGRGGGWGEPAHQGGGGWERWGNDGGAKGWQARAGGWEAQGGQQGGGGWGGQGAGWGGQGDHGARWRTGLGGGGKGWGTKQHGGVDLPPGMKDRPFGEQLYLKRVRELQEREAREAAALAAAGGAPDVYQSAPPPVAAAPKPPLATEDPAIFGNAFPRHAFPFTPAHSAAPAPPLSGSAPFATNPAAVPAAAVGPPHVPGGFADAGAGPQLPSTLQDRLKAQLAGQKAQPTVDPDNGGGGGWGAPAAAAGEGWEQPAQAGAAGGATAGAVPSAANGWKGSMPW